MAQHLIPSGVLAAVVGAAMAVAVSSSPSFGFTLSSPSPAEPVVKADVQQVWYPPSLLPPSLLLDRLSSLRRYPRQPRTSDTLR
jgi:hypothetical protein